MVKYNELKLIILQFYIFIELLEATQQSPHYGYNQTVIVSINYLKTQEEVITVIHMKETQNSKKIIVKAILNPTYNKTG